MEHFLSKELIWTRKPQQAVVTQETVEIVTEPHTDLWQRTYYGFQNDNAPVLQIRTKEPYFSFTVRTEFHSKRRFDQCGIALYLDSENWLKASIEYENERFQRLGSVVTNHGYSRRDHGNVVPAEPAGERLLHRVQRGRHSVPADAHLPPVEWRRRNFLWHLRL